MSSAWRFIFTQIKVIFIRMVSHLDSLWSRGARELGNGLSTTLRFATIKPRLSLLSPDLFGPLWHWFPDRHLGKHPWNPGNEVLFCNVFPQKQNFTIANLCHVWLIYNQRYFLIWIFFSLWFPWHTTKNTLHLIRRKREADVHVCRYLLLMINVNQWVSGNCHGDCRVTGE